MRPIAPPQARDRATDLDGDGRADLVVANLFGNTLSVFLNTTVAGGTTPTFATPQLLPTGTAPRSTTFTDVDADGRLDLVVANGSSATVSVLRNTQFSVRLAGTPATGTIDASRLFANGFD